MVHTIKHTQILGLLLLILMTVSCERDISEDAVPATFPTTAEVYTDNPVGLTDEFFISFDPAGGANPEAFGTDDNEAYLGSSSIRIDVPAPNDPNGNFVGGIFKDRGDGRNLTGYDALTFWVKGSLTGSLEAGFGTDFEIDEFPVSAFIDLATDWRKVIIPIPDPSRLVQEKGMFLFAAGSFDVLGDDNPDVATSFDDNVGYTIWIDEIRFEKLGTLGQGQPKIFNGVDETLETFSGSTIQTTGISYTANLPSGMNQSVQLSTNYFTFSSSNPDVATVTDTGEITVLTSGEATITATVGNLSADGSLQITTTGDFENAPDPTLPESDVLSIYSDFYSVIDGLDVGAFNNDGINIEAQTFNGNELIEYQNLGFVGIGWNDTVDVSGFTHIHLDVQRLTSGSNFIVELLDYGPDGIDNGFGDGSAGGFNATSQMIDEEWVGLDIPLNSFTLPTGAGGAGNPNLNNIGNIILVSNSGAFLIDNVYFY
ncbi:MAG: Ig-like domain-containing protein [Psychroflexus sp.]|nr:Ig-like domain-containing protein [Psychroflexus sp.]